MEGVGWLSVPWGGGGWGEKKKGGRATPLGPPIQYSLAPLKRAQSWGVDVDYKGGASCRRADVRVLWGGRVTQLALIFSFALNHHLHRRHRHPRPLGLAFSSRL